MTLHELQSLYDRRQKVSQAIARLTSRGDTVRTMLQVAMAELARIDERLVREME